MIPFESISIFSSFITSIQPIVVENSPYDTKTLTIHRAISKIKEQNYMVQKIKGDDMVWDLMLYQECKQTNKQCQKGYAAKKYGSYMHKISMMKGRFMQKR